MCIVYFIMVSQLYNYSHLRSLPSHFFFSFCDPHIFKLSILISPVFTLMFPTLRFFTLQNQYFYSSKLTGTLPIFSGGTAGNYCSYKSFVQVITNPSEIGCYQLPSQRGLAADPVFINPSWHWHIASPSSDTPAQNALSPHAPGRQSSESGSITANSYIWGKISTHTRFKSWGA